MRLKTSERLTIKSFDSQQTLMFKLKHRRFIIVVLCNKTLPKPQVGAEGGDGHRLAVHHDRRARPRRAAAKSGAVVPSGSGGNSIAVQTTLIKEFIAKTSSKRET